MVPVKGVFPHLSGLLLLVDDIQSQPQATVSQGRICSDNCTCCHTEIEHGDQTCYLIHLQPSGTTEIEHGDQTCYLIHLQPSGTTEIEHGDQTCCLIHLQPSGTTEIEHGDQACYLIHLQPSGITEIEHGDQTCYLIQPQHSGTGPTSPSADPVMPGAWQGSHLSQTYQC